MTVVWLVVGVVGAATVALKAVGPVLVGGKELPPALLRVVELLAPALLAALVVVQIFGGDRELVVDARATASLPRGQRSFCARRSSSWWRRPRSRPLWSAASSPRHTSATASSQKRADRSQVADCH